jgi:hypothetical protein
MSANLTKVFDEPRRRGVKAFRLEVEHVRLIPKAAVPPKQVTLVRKTKPALLPRLRPLSGAQSEMPR